jgi:uncharacterized membrane protein YbhN (UPF0104 family)
VNAADAGVADAGTDRRNSRTAVLVKIAFGVAVAAFGIAFVVSRWTKVRSALSDTSPGWVVVAVVAAAAGQWAAALGFRAAFAATSRELPVRDVARMYFVSQLGKYLPGSVWPIVTVTQMSRRYGIGRPAAAVGSMLSLMFSLVLGAIIGAVMLLVGVAKDVSGLWWLLLVLPVCVAALQPSWIAAVVNRAFRLARREPVDVRLRGRLLIEALGWPALSWLLLGLQCWALVVALGGPVLGSLAGSIGGFALAYVAGTLFVPAPAGAGVREAVLGVALAGVVAHSATFTHEHVLVVVLLSRFLLAVLDFVQAGVATVLNRRAATGLQGHSGPIQ